MDVHSPELNILCPNIQYLKLTIERIYVLIIYGEVLVLFWMLCGLALNVYCLGLVEGLSVTLVLVLLYHWSLS
jgi:hypothetical protein